MSLLVFASMCCPLKLKCPPHQHQLIPAHRQRTSLLRLPQMSESTQPGAGTKVGERPALPPGVLFTCMTCRVGFAAAAAHREHFKSDWHRYNLKRKVRVHPLTGVWHGGISIAAQLEGHAVCA